jgi:hypothetical protein
MATFQDNLSRTWHIDITVIELKKLKDEFQLDLGECASRENKILAQLSTNTVLLVDVLSCLLEEQIKHLGLNERQFAQGIVGAGITKALDALVEAIINFSQPREGQVLRAMWNKLEATKELATERVLGRMEELDVDQLVTQQIDEALKTLPRKSGG